MKEKTKFIYLAILFIFLISSPILSAVWWNPFTWFEQEIPLKDIKGFEKTGEIIDGDFKVTYPQETSGRTIYSDKIVYEIEKAIIQDCSGKKIGIKMIYEEPIIKEDGKIVLTSPKTKQLKLDYNQDGRIASKQNLQNVEYYYSEKLQEYREEVIDYERDCAGGKCGGTPYINITKYKWVDWVKLKTPAELNKIIDSSCRTKSIEEHTTNVTDCATLSADTYYTQNESFYGSSNDCITIDAPNIVYDAQGYNARTSGENLFLINYGNVTVKNGGLFRQDAGNYVFSLEVCPSDGTIYIDNISRIFNSNDYAGGILVDDGCHLELTNIGNRTGWQGIEIYPDNDVRYGVSNYFSGYVDLIENVTFDLRGDMTWGMREWGSTAPSHRGDWVIKNIRMRYLKSGATSPRGIWAATYDLDTAYFYWDEGAEGNSAGYNYVLYAGDNANAKNVLIQYDDANGGRTNLIRVVGAGAVLNNVTTQYLTSGTWNQEALYVSGSGNTFVNSTFSVWCSGTHSSSYRCDSVRLTGATSNVFNNVDINQAGNPNNAGSGLWIDNFAVNNIIANSTIDSPSNSIGAVELGDSAMNYFYDSYSKGASEYDLVKNNDAGGAGADYFINVTLGDGWGDIDISDGEIYKQWWSRVAVNSTKYGSLVQDSLVVATSKNTSYQGNLPFGKTQSSGWTLRKALTENYYNSSGTYGTYFDLDVANPEVGKLENAHPTNNTDFVVNMTLTLQPMPETHCAGNTSNAWVSFILLDSKGDLMLGSPTAKLYDYKNNLIDSGNMVLEGQHYYFNTTSISTQGTYRWLVESDGGDYPCVFSAGSGGGGSTTTSIVIVRIDSSLPYVKIGDVLDFT